MRLVKLASIAILLVISLLSFPALAGAQDTVESVKTETRPLTVKYSNGRTEQYMVEWSGTVHNRHWESGGPAVPLSGHFVDDRQCHWELTPKIVRKLYFVNANGDRFAKEDLTEAYNVTFANQGSSFMLIGLRSENCGDADARYRSDVNNAHTNLTQQWETMVNADFQKLVGQIKEWQKVVKVTDSSKVEPVKTQTKPTK